MLALAAWMSLVAAAPSDAVCPSTPAQWDEWKGKVAGSILSSDQIPEGTASRALPVLKACGVSEKDPEFENISRFLQALVDGSKHASSMGFKVTDNEYLRENDSFFGIPSELHDPKFLAEVSDPVTADAAVAKLRKSVNADLPEPAKWKFLRYRSRHLQMPDDAETYDRILIYIPGDRPRFIQFGVGMSADNPSDAITEIGIDSQTRGQTHAYFKDFWKSQESGLYQIRTRLVNQEGGTGRCYDCHKNPVLPILPSTSYPVNAQDLAEMNRIIETYRYADFGPHLNPADFGPAMGDPSLTEQRTDTFFDSCLKGLHLREPTQTRTKLRTAMNCAECHQSDKLGPINFPMGSPGAGASVDMIHSFVSSGLMPRGKDQPPLENTADNQEREGLVRCLKTEYYGDPQTGTLGAFQKWLTLTLRKPLGSN